MIGLILGTSEGKEILKKLNIFTEDIFVTTATVYGSELLKDYKYKYINSSPLTKEALKAKLIQYGVTILVDATHPYAVEITQNTKNICREINIKYIRFERPSIIEKYLKYDNVKLVNSIEDIGNEIMKRKIEGTILNTTGSRNVDKFMGLKLPNKIIHRVLPTAESIEKCLSYGVKVEDIVAIKGPIGKELNVAFIKEYDAKVIVLKDSGAAGGTEEKLISAIEQQILAFILRRKEDMNIENKFHNIDSLVDYIHGIITERKN